MPYALWKAVASYREFRCAGREYQRTEPHLHNTAVSRQYSSTGEWVAHNDKTKVQLFLLLPKKSGDSMKSSIKVVLLVVLALVLAFASGRAAWDIRAGNLSREIVAQFADQSSGPDEFIASIRADNSSIRTLAYTCVLVAECTPTQHKNAIELSKLEDKRLDAYVAYLKIRDEAIAKYQAGDIEGLRAIEQPYLDAKKTLYGLTTETHDATENGNLPGKLRPDFVALN